MYPVTKSSSSEELPVIFRDDDAYHTNKTGIAFGSVSLKFRKKNATSWTTDTIDATNWTEVGDGHYTWNPASGDLDTEGPLIYIVQAADCVQYEGAAYVTINKFDDLATDIAALNDPTAAAVADAVLDEVMSGHTTAGTLGKYVNDLDTNVDQSLSGTESNIRGADSDDLKDISDEIATIKTKTDGLPADTSAELDAIDSAIAALNDIAVTDILSDSTAFNGADIAGIKAKTDNLPADTSAELDAIDAAISALNDPTATAIADAVLDEPMVGHVAVGSLGALLNDDLDAAVSSRSSHSAADVQALLNDLSAAEMLTAITTDDTKFAGALIANLSNLDQALSVTELNIRGADSDTLETLSDQIDGIGGGGVCDGAEAIADAVLNELLADHTTAGSLSAIVQAIYDATGGDGHCDFE